MRNKYLTRARISETDFRSLLRLWAADVPALSAAKIARVNRNTTHRLYGLLRRRVVALAEAEAAPFRQGTIEIDESYFGPRRVPASPAAPGTSEVFTESISTSCLSSPITSSRMAVSVANRMRPGIRCG